MADSCHVTKVYVELLALTCRQCGCDSFLEWRKRLER